MILEDIKHGFSIEGVPRVGGGDPTIASCAYDVFTCSPRRRG